MKFYRGKLSLEFKKFTHKRSRIMNDFSKKIIFLKEQGAPIEEVRLVEILEKEEEWNLLSNVEKRFSTLDNKFHSSSFSNISTSLTSSIGAPCSFKNIIFLLKSFIILLLLCVNFLNSNDNLPL